MTSTPPSVALLSSNQELNLSPSQSGTLEKISLNRLFSVIPITSCAMSSGSSIVWESASWIRFSFCSRSSQILDSTVSGFRRIRTLTSRFWPYRERRPTR